MSLLITNTTIFTNDDDNQVLPDAAVVVEGNSIAAVGSAEDLSAAYPEAEGIDGDGRLLMPGLVNVHMHFYGLYARGLALRTQPRNFGEILAQLWWKLDRALDLDAVYYSALVPAIGAVKAGVTAVVDHHASPNAVDGSLDRLEAALRQVGLRGVLCYEVSDRDGKAVRDKGLAENARYIRQCQAARERDASNPYDGMVGLHASFTLNDDSLEAAADLSRTLRRGCHIHVLEDRIDESETRAKYDAGVVERLHDFGILGEDSIAAHGIYLDDQGRELIAASDTIVAHNPQSNMNNAVGRADVFGLMERGVLAGLGTDGMTPDIRAEARTGYLMHKDHLRNPNAGWNEWQTMVLKNNPVIYQRLTGQKVGRVAPGYMADLILLDYYPPTPLTGDNIWGHFLFGLVDAPVDTTIINGRVVMRHKEIVGIDEGTVAAQSRACAEKVWQRFYE